MTAQSLLEVVDILSVLMFLLLKICQTVCTLWICEFTVCHGCFSEAVAKDDGGLECRERVQVEEASAFLDIRRHMDKDMKGICENTLTLL